MRLPELGVKRPVTTIMIFMAILLAGVVFYMQLQQDVLPDVEMPSLTVITVYPGASAEDVEQQVTKILEENLASTPNLTKITSKSKENVAFISLAFEWGADLSDVSNDVRDKLDIAKPFLPDDAHDPVMVKINSAMMPIVVYGIEAEESWAAADKIIDDMVLAPLKKVNGVGQVVLLGQPEREIKVKIDPFRLQAFRMTPNILATLLKAENVTIPGGTIKTGINDLAVRIPGEFKSLDELANITLMTFNGQPVRLKDVATITDGFKEKEEMYRSNRNRAAGMMVMKQSGANTLDVYRDITNELVEIQKKLPADMKVSELINSAETVTFSLDNLKNTIGWAGLFVILVVIFFLRDVRSSLIVILTIPFSLIGTFAFMKIFGYTLNIFSGMALAIAIGMVVDNAIVVLENITKHIEKGERPREAAIFGTSEMGMAIGASTLTTIAVFLPLLGIGGLPGLLFEQLSVLTPVTLLISLFTALLLTPMLSSKLLKPVRDQKKSKGRVFQFSERLFVKTEDVYSTILRWSLNHRKTVLSITMVLFVISLLAAKMTGIDYLPEFDMGDVNVVFELEQGTRTEETFRITQKIEEIVTDEIDRTGKSEDLRGMYSLTGQTETGLMSLAGFDEGKNIGTVMTKLVMPDQRDYSAKSLAMSIEKRVREIPEIIKFHVSGGSILAATMTGNKAPVEVHLSGNDLKALNQKAIEITRILEGSPLLTGIESTVDRGKEEINVVIDRQKAGALGLRSGAIALAVRQALYGTDAGSFKEDGDEYDITVQLDQAYRGQVSDLKNIRLTTGTGQQVPLQQVARIETQSGPLEIRRESQQRIVYVKVKLKPDVDLGTGVAEVQQLLADIEIPDGVTMELAGQMGDQNDDMAKMILAFVIGLILVYMVMASQFESLKHPFIIMFAVPLAIIGVIWAFVISGTTLSMVSAIGIIMLVGVVVNNGIVLVDYINLLRQRGQSIIEAAANAGHSRLRPVVMTAFTTIFAMVPMAVSNGTGAEMWKPIGITVIGGLLISTLITLILIPVLYLVFHLREVKQETAA